MDRKMLAQLKAQGIDSTTHHATVGKAYKALTGEKLDKDTLNAIRALIDEVEEAKTLTPEQRMERADAIVAERAQDADMPGWANVVQVVEAGETGNPVRVLIECADPQERKGVSVCEGTREIAAQDVFQVTRCLPCQKRAFILKRGAKAKAKRAAKQAAKAAKAPKREEAKPKRRKAA